MWSVNAPSKSNNGCAHKKVRRAEDKERGAGGGWVGLKTKKKKNMQGESSMPFACFFLMTFLINIGLCVKNQAQGCFPCPS